MKINLIGMILNNCGRKCFDGAVLDDNGKPMPAADSLHHMIMEYAKVVNGGTSDCVTTSREEAMTQVDYDRNWWRSAIVDACEPQDCWMAWKFTKKLDEHKRDTRHSTQSEWRACSSMRRPRPRRLLLQTHCQLHEDDPQAGGMEIASGA